MTISKSFGLLGRLMRVFNMDATFLLYRHRELIWNLVLRDFKGRFSGSMLGFYWAALHPLLLISVYLAVFTFVFSVRLGGESSNSLEYALFAAVGLVPWLGFVEATSRSNTALTSHVNLVKQVVFPIEILPVQIVISSFITQCVGMVAVTLVSALALGRLSFVTLLLPLVLLAQVFFSLGMAWLLASINVFFRDTKEIVQALLTVGLFATPVLYIETMVPPLLALPIALNPITHLLHMYRDVLFYGQLLHPWSFVIFTTLAVLVFFAGYTFFVKTKFVFSDLL